ncbi:hypothetical protein, partial [Mesorhizobium sp.]|uniref:hypothetical protein n=1 Tax=Mesorhizobium sp. TaxID=1871066 RepID=UPI0025E8B120
MSLSLQKWLRFVTPGFLILVFSWFLGKATGLWGFQLPEKPQEALPTLTVLIPAAIYYLTPLRSSSNQKY